MNELPRFGKPLDDQAARWRSALLRTLTAHSYLPLLLSGGVDSGTLLAALLDLDVEPPTCYAYRLSGTESPDFDAAERMAADFGCPFVEVVVPELPDRARSDVAWIVRELRTARKTSVQVCHPTLYLLNAVRRDGHAAVLTGTGGVVLDNREVSVRWAEDRESVPGYRCERIDDWRNPDSATGKMHELAGALGVELVEPYSREPVRSAALKIPWDEMNAGPPGFGQKGIAVRAFPEFWVEPGRYRRNASLQSAGGVREFHQRTFGGPTARDPVVAYREMLRAVEAEESGQGALI